MTGRSRRRGTRAPTSSPSRSTSRRSRCCSPPDKGGHRLEAPMQTLTFFENIKLYVGFTDASSAALRELHPSAQPFFGAIVDDFYAAIEAHPGASRAITGGTSQIERLK